MTLTEFLTARLDEDEAAALAAADVWRHQDFGELEHHCGDHIARHDPARVLRDVEAKQALIDGHGATDEDECPGCHAYLDGTWVTRAGQLCPVLAAVGSIYADHPDYRQEWRPQA